MTKYVSYDVNNFQANVLLKFFKTSGNTGGTLRVGFNNNDAWFDINLDDYAANAWHEIEQSYVFSFSSVSGKFSLDPSIRIKGADPLTGGDVWIGEFRVLETRNTSLIPQNSQTASYILRLEDNGKHVYITTGGVTVPPQSDVSFPLGYVVSIVNASGSAQTITQGAGVTLRLAGTATTGNRTLAAYGIATLLRVALNEWSVTGNVT